MAVTDSGVHKAKSALHKANHKAKHVVAKPWVDWVVRLGFVVRGLIYITIGGLALQLALGSGGETTDPTGAIATLGQLPLGKPFLIVIAIGLAGYSLWGFVRAIFDPLQHGTDAKGLTQRFGHLVSGLSYAALFAPTLLYLLTPSAPQPGSGTDMAENLWTQPLGAVLIFAIAIFWVVAGLGQGYTALTGRFAEELDEKKMHGWEKKGSKIIGRIGILSRSIVFIIIGLITFHAAFAPGSERSLGIDGALGAITRAPYGGLLLGVIAAGLILFGLFSILTARWHDGGHKHKN